MDANGWWMVDQSWIYQDREREYQACTSKANLVWDIHDTLRFRDTDEKWKLDNVG